MRKFKLIGAGLVRTPAFCTHWARARAPAGLCSSARRELAAKDGCATCIQSPDSIGTGKFWWSMCFENRFGRLHTILSPPENSKRQIFISSEATYE